MALDVDGMRMCRLMFAAVMAIALAALPIEAAAAMSHAHKAQMSLTATGDDCPCCHPAQPLKNCPLKCCHLQAIPVDDQVIAVPLAAPDVSASTNFGAAVSIRPDPPPPRS